MAERTVKELLAGLHRGHWSVEAVADEFRARDWPQPREAASLAQAYGVEDDDDPIDAADDNSWDVVQVDPWLTSEQYQVLAAAHAEALNR